MGTWGVSANHETEGKHHRSGLDSLVPSAFSLPLTANKDGEAVLLVVFALTAFLMAGCVIWRGIPTVFLTQATGLCFLTSWLT